ncbi:MAG: D-alanyl-D-alanine carboxypeptidase/D-alanyl-D-alanine-endopeptidase [Actinomycetes bacterium]
MSATHHRRQAATAGALAALGVLTIVAALRPTGGSPGAGAASEPTAPIVDVRRFPAVVAEAVGAQRLDAELGRLAGGVEGCWAIDDGGVAITTREPDRALRPASTLKMVTAAAALELLGPRHRFTTAAVATGSGTPRALVLVGGGDPGLATPRGVAAIAGDPERRGSPTTRLAALADRIAATGLRSLPEGIRVDDARYDSVRYSPSWPDSYRATGQVGPVGALTVDAGWRDPANRLGTPADPAIATGEALAALLEARGVDVGPVSRGAAPAGARTVASVTSAPLREVVGGILAASNNHGAEMLLKELAVTAGTRPGTSESGARAARAALERLGVSTAGLEQLDGSGLARDDRASCRTLLGVLQLGDRARFRALRDGLAVAGERGTLADRLAGSPLRGRLVAKTGTLNGTSGLVGTTTVRRPVGFALLLNGPLDEATAKARREAMAAAIARFPDAPDPDTLVPVPGAP